MANGGQERRAQFDVGCHGVSFDWGPLQMAPTARPYLIPELAPSLGIAGAQHGGPLNSRPMQRRKLGTETTGKLARKSPRSYVRLPLNTCSLSKTNIHIHKHRFMFM